jgi:hypothetical protein
MHYQLKHTENTSILFSYTYKTQKREKYIENEIKQLNLTLLQCHCEQPH